MKYYGKQTVSILITKENGKLNWISLLFLNALGRIYLIGRESTLDICENSEGDFWAFQGLWGFCHQFCITA